MKERESLKGKRTVSTLNSIQEGSLRFTIYLGGHLILQRGKRVGRGGSFSNPIGKSPLSSILNSRGGEGGLVLKTGNRSNHQKPK